MSSAAIMSWKPRMMPWPGVRRCRRSPPPAKASPTNWTSISSGDSSEFVKCRREQKSCLIPKPAASTACDRSAIKRIANAGGWQYPATGSAARSLRPRTAVIARPRLPFLVGPLSGADARLAGTPEPLRHASAMLPLVDAPLRSLDERSPGLPALRSLSEKPLRRASAPRASGAETRFSPVFIRTHAVEERREARWPQ